MSYLVYDESGELIEVFDDLTTSHEIDSYKQRNPLHIIKPAEDIDKEFLLNEEVVEEEEESGVVAWGQ